MEKLNLPSLSQIGLILIIIGTLAIIISKTGYPKLPGDIYFKRGNFTLIAPITSSILISFILTIILRFINK